MKVKIGKYPKHRWYHNWLYNWFDYSSKQKINVRIDPWDTWNMDCTLAYIVVPMLKQLKKTKQGAPNVDDDDVPVDLKSITAPTFNGENGEVDDNHFKRWDYVLDEMIFAFDSKIDASREKQFETGVSDLQWRDKENWVEIIEGPNHTKVYDREGEKKYEDRVQNGFRLFGKYYPGLWT